MLSLIIFMIALSSGGAFGAAILKRKYSDMLPVTVAGIMFIMLAAGIAGHLSAGTCICLGLTAILNVISVVYAVIHHAISDTLKRFFSADLLIFAIVIFFLSIGTVGMEVTVRDDFNHWQDTVKNMFYTGALSTYTPENVIFPSYVPGMSLIQYFLQSINQIVNPLTGYSEWRTQLAYKIVCSAMLMPIFRIARFKKPLSILAGIIIVIVIPGLYYNKYYTSSLIDPFLGIMAGIGLAYLIIYNEDRLIKVISACSASFILIMTKDAGLVFAVMLIIGMIISEFQTRNRLSIFKKLTSCAAVIVSCIVPKVLWNAHTSAMGIARKYNNRIIISELIRIVFNNDDTWRQKSWNGFYKKFILDRLSMSGYFNINISYLTGAVILIAAAAILLFLLWKSYNPFFSIARNITIISLAQFILYTIGVAVEYIFQFGELEGSQYASYGRYVKVGFLGISVIILLLALLLIYSEWKYRYIICICGLTTLILFMPVKSIKKFIIREYVKNSVEDRAPFDEFERQLKYITTEGKVYFICQQDTGMLYYRFKYVSKPIQFQSGRWSFSDVPRYENDVYEYDMDPDEWMNLLAGEYDYVVVYKADEYFEEKYGSLFDGQMKSGIMRYYRVNKEKRVLECLE